MEENKDYIENSSLIIDHFGYWPDFHDSEIVSIFLERNYPVEPKLTIVLYSFEMTNKIDENGYYKLTKHCKIEIGFIGIGDNDINGFNFQNAISGLDIFQQDGVIKVNIEPAYGVGGYFTCKRVEVKGLEKLDEAHPWVAN